jgi:hypothetical protein
MNLRAIPRKLNPAPSSITVAPPSGTPSPAGEKASCLSSLKPSVAVVLSVIDWIVSPSSEMMPNLPTSSFAACRPLVKVNVNPSESVTEMVKKPGLAN